MLRITKAALCSLALALCSAYAAASITPGPDTFKVDYFSNANTSGAPDGTVRLTNPGTNGSLCAGVFVFDEKQELAECCSCSLSPNGLRKLSVNTDLTANPLTGVVLTDGSIEIVSSTPEKGGVCPDLPTSLNPVAGIRAWATHIQDSNFMITETASQDATLSRDEVKSLTGQCTAISLDSHGGTCTCGTGD